MLKLANHVTQAMDLFLAVDMTLGLAGKLNFLLAPILAIAKIATMVGLLGTVISMIGTFSAISSAKGGNEVTGQAGAIGLALFATALGLLTAIPLVFTHVLFKDWIAAFEVQMKASAQRLIVLFQNIKPKLGEVKPVTKDKDKDKKDGDKEKDGRARDSRDRDRDRDRSESRGRER